MDAVYCRIYFMVNIMGLADKEGRSGNWIGIHWKQNLIWVGKKEKEKKDLKGL